MTGIRPVCPTRFVTGGNSGYVENDSVRADPGALAG